MTRITSYTQLPTFERNGDFLNVYWGELEVPPSNDGDTLEGGAESGWSYFVARAKTSDDRETLINRILSVDPDAVDLAEQAAYYLFDAQVPPSWTWVDGRWIAPVPRPDDGAAYTWDEGAQAWVEIDNPDLAGDA